MNVADVRADLIAEQDALDALVADLPAEAWATPTASPRWSVADQIGHLAYFDAAAALAIADPDGFRARTAELLEAVGAGDEDGATLGEFRAMDPAGLLGAWRANRALLADAAAGLDDDARVGWYGPSMGAKSFLTARLMECWAHGQDVVDALGLDRPATGRLRHVAQIGFITRGWSYANRGLTPPDTTVRLELDGPDGDVWVFGPDDADETVRGSALGFCLVVTQRRHLDDTDLEVGPIAREWLTIAQAFAGRATDGPAARA